MSLSGPGSAFSPLVALPLHPRLEGTGLASPHSPHLSPSVSTTPRYSSDVGYSLHPLTNVESLHAPRSRTGSPPFLALTNLTSLRNADPSSAYPSRGDVKMEGDGDSYHWLSMSPYLSLSGFEKIVILTCISRPSLMSLPPIVEVVNAMLALHIHSLHSVQWECMWFF